MTKGKGSKVRVPKSLFIGQYNIIISNGKVLLSQSGGISRAMLQRDLFLEDESAHPIWDADGRGSKSTAMWAFVRTSSRDVNVGVSEQRSYIHFAIHTFTYLLSSFHQHKSSCEHVRRYMACGASSFYRQVIRTLQEPAFPSLEAQG